MAKSSAKSSSSSRSSRSAAKAAPKAAAKKATKKKTTTKKASTKKATRKTPASAITADDRQMMILKAFGNKRIKHLTKPEVFSRLKTDHAIDSLKINGTCAALVGKGLLKKVTVEGVRGNCWAITPKGHKALAKK